MTLPLITAAVTAYNAEDTIVPALESALAQDWLKLEILVVDDTSTDRTAALIEDLIKTRNDKARPIRLIRMSANGGVSTARNRLVDEAHGEFIAFFDDDDVSAPDRIRKQYDRIIECERSLETNFVICHTSRLQLYPDGSRRYKATLGTGAQNIPQGIAVAERLLVGRLTKGVLGSCAACAMMARKGVYNRIGDFDPALRRASDTEYDIRAALEGCAFAGLAEPLVTQTMTMATEKTLAAYFDAYNHMLIKHGDYLRERGWLDFCQQWQYVRYAWLRYRRIEFSMRLAGVLFRHPAKLMQKLVWSLPALGSQRIYRRWHLSEAALHDGPAN
jgi:glycosyltransferase involved in cell wall biosynthesis